MKALDDILHYFGVTDILHIDYETFSAWDLKKVGAYKYVRHPAFKVILCAVKLNDNPVQVFDLYDSYDALPTWVLDALGDPNILKVAHNANFEMVVSQAAFGIEIDATQWYCTMVGAAHLALPMSLGDLAKFIGLEQQKDTRGKTLIRYFCGPVKKPSKKDKFREVNRPADAPDAWNEFKEYNAQDVETEVAVFEYLMGMPSQPVVEWDYWALDQIVNERGITISQPFVYAAIRANSQAVEDAFEQITTLTSVDNPNSLTQLRKWISTKTGQDWQAISLAKQAIEDNLQGGMLSDEVEKLYKLRQISSRTSVSKYARMLDMVDQTDSRIRGTIQYYGAPRTGRYSGRGIQVHNFKKTFSNADQINALAKKTGHDPAAVRLVVGDALLTAREAIYKGVAAYLYDDVSDIVSKTVRTAIIAPAGRDLVVDDYSAIEARLTAWLAGEQWQLDVFRGHGKIYEATAAKMFGLPIEMITKGSDLRQKGKVASLALGYQGAVGALVTMGALRQGLTEDELPAIVAAWRAANPAIVSLWKKVEAAAKRAVLDKTSVTLKLPYTSIRFRYHRGSLFITLPSGRFLSYPGVRVDNGKLSYAGYGNVNNWTRVKTYGGSLVENIVQAMARDLLADAMLRMDDMGIYVIMHVHDEVVAESDEARSAWTLKIMNDIMSKGPDWAEGLPLRGDGFISKYYRKDSE